MENSNSPHWCKPIDINNSIINMNNSTHEMYNAIKLDFYNSPNGTYIPPVKLMSEAKKDLDQNNPFSSTYNTVDSFVIKTEPFTDSPHQLNRSIMDFQEKIPKKPPKDLTFCCMYCPKAFAKKQQLQNHTKTHTKEKNFKCDSCGKSFIHKQQLTNHYKTHTGDKSFKCSYCEKCFALKQQLQIHMKRHTGEKDFACTMCEKAFITKQQLQNHVNSHLGIKPFLCNDCPKQFTLKQQLERHRKKHGVQSQNFHASGVLVN